MEFRKMIMMTLYAAAAAAAKLLQSCLTLWDPIDSSQPGSPVPGILQARVLERGAIAFLFVTSHFYTLCTHYLVNKQINRKRP